MKLNKLEFIFMNNPVRAIIQERYELGILRRMSSRRDIDTALEIGCGNGTGTRLIKKYFSPKNIVAIEPVENDQVLFAQCGERIKEYYGADRTRHL